MASALDNSSRRWDGFSGGRPAAVAPPSSRSAARCSPSRRPSRRPRRPTRSVTAGRPAARWTSVRTAAAGCASADRCRAAFRREGRSGATAHDRGRARPSTAAPIRPNRRPRRQGGAAAAGRPSASGRPWRKRLAGRRPSISPATQGVPGLGARGRRGPRVLTPLSAALADLTIPIAAAARGSFQSGFNEVAPASHGGRICEGRPYRSLQIPIDPGQARAGLPGPASTIS